MDFDGGTWQAWAGLMKLTQEGDVEAYARLLSEISPLVFGYVRKRVFDPANVDDVYQDVLMTLHKARHTYQPDRELSPWLFAVMRNAVWTALGKTRKFSAREVRLEEFHEMTWVAPDPDGLDDRLQHALSALSPEHRQAVEMLKLREMSVDQAARELGITKVALRVRAHRGYVQLRKILSRKSEP